MLIKAFALSALAVAAVVMPARAERTPALPFFSKPFPTGYSSASHCLVQHRDRTRRGGAHTTTIDLCAPAISAKD